VRARHTTSRPPKPEADSSAARPGVLTSALGSCFDAPLMAQTFTSRSCPMLAAAVWLGLSSSPVLAEPSLANLLGGGSVQQEPTAELEQLLHALERRPFVADAHVQQALGQARSELLRLREAYARGERRAVVQRRASLVWAALSAADRLQARVATAAALAGLELRARDAEAAAERARQALERSRLGGAAALPAESAP